MKWVTTDYKGNPVTYYTGDVIETIKGIVNAFEKDCEGKVCNCLCCAILEFIESEDNK